MPATSSASTDHDATAHRPLRRDAERNRRRILAAAAEAFAERGLGVTMDEIADVAGIGVGTVYRRFRDKRELIDALFEERVYQVGAMAAEAAEDPDPWRGLVSFLERSMAIEASNRGLSQLLRFDMTGCARVGAAREQVVPLIDALLRRAQDSGQVRADLTRTDLLVYKGMLLHVARLSHDMAPQLWRRYFALLLATLRADPDGDGEPLPVPALTNEQLASAGGPPSGHRHPFDPDEP